MYLYYISCISTRENCTLNKRHSPLRVYGSRRNFDIKNEKSHTDRINQLRKTLSDCLNASSHCWQTQKLVLICRIEREEENKGKFLLQTARCPKINYIGALHPTPPGTLFSRYSCVLRKCWENSTIDATQNIIRANL